jgi:hypothetical protein
MKITEITFGEILETTDGASCYNYTAEETARHIEEMNERLGKTIRLNELREIESIRRARDFICR